ncbi:site-specific DNA-methyltransferase [Psychrobacter pulmonis]|uniref:site-specific DNA-methyltransferase n=1 Tax=Psychrobacter pulmonis TaxID=228654 RepID=UPI00191A7A87|nr:site-specific DNA-methyltransferase [Psychrobacter pulmonis]
MPTLNWIGKEAVEKHHKEVPFRLLEPVEALSCGDADSGNLIVQGDNLDALKALLPRYAGKVKCIYIDPPYNTGNEGWVYNDNVNSPEIKKWLGEVVGKEGETLDRHDRWLCMMYPRLLLLKQFLTEDGVIFASIDDNAHCYLRFLLDEIFGSNCYKNTIAVRRGIKNVQAQFDDWSALAVGHEYILMYSKNKSTRLPKLMLEHEVEKPGKWDTFWRGTDRPTMRYKLFEFTPDKGQWRWERGRATKAQKNYEYYLNNIQDDMSLDEWFIENLTANNSKLDFVRENDQGSIQYYVPPSSGKILSDNWMDILLSGTETTFETEKSIKIIERIISWITKEGDVILDSFAGSGTTAHAVMAVSHREDCKRDFIAIEMVENISKNILIPRLKNAVTGYTKGKKEIPPLGGGFQVLKLSKSSLFSSDGQIRSDVTFKQLAEFVWFIETGTGLNQSDLKATDKKSSTPYLGQYKDRAMFLLYNDILKDKSDAGGNVLNGRTLELLEEALPDFKGQKIVYGARTRFDKTKLARLNITFHQLPYELAVKTWF